MRRPTTSAPVPFVENTGQWSHSARFVAAAGATVVLATEEGFEVVRREPGAEPTAQRFRFEGARRVRPHGHGRLPGTHSYYLGPDPDRWRSGLPGFAGLAYAELYPGIELRLRQANGRLEYDLLLAPGAEVAAIRIACPDARGLRIDDDGGLSMESDEGRLRQTPPVTWSVLPDGRTLPLECSFVLHGDRSFGFELPEHDEQLPVVIDPGLEWCTFLGGPLADIPAGIVTRPDGSVLQYGLTQSGNFPSTVPPIGPLGITDAFVTILDPTGSTLLHSLVLGGSASDAATDLAIGSGGELFLTGATSSTDFPVTAGTAIQTTYGGGGVDVFVMRLSTDLGTLLQSTYLGGSGLDTPSRLLLQDPAVVTLGGGTDSTDFPTTPGSLQTTYGGGLGDMFVTTLDLDRAPAAQLLYSTFLGGSGQDHPLYTGTSTLFTPFDLETMSGGRLALVGASDSPNLPTLGGYQMTKADGMDGYLAILDPSQPGPAALTYGSYLGGNDFQVLQSMEVDSQGRLNAAGYTTDPDVPLTVGAFRTDFFGPAGLSDAWVVRIDPTLPPADQLVYGTLIAGEGWEQIPALACDGADRIVVVGSTGDQDQVVNEFPTTCSGVQQDFGGERDLFVAYLDPAGNGASDLLYSTFLGGFGYDMPHRRLSIVQEMPTVVIRGGGMSQSPDFPATPGAFDTSFGGTYDAILFQLELNPHTYCAAAPNSFDPDGAILCGAGSTRLADNDFTLRVRSAVPGQAGLFYFGTQAIQAPFGNGLRCVGGTTFRLNPPGLADATGAAARPLDFNSSPGSVIGAGTTWYAQYWYRDPAAGGAAFNLSNGLRLHAHP